MQAFLSKLEWRKVDDVQGGITWLELFILHAIHGGTCEEEEEEGRRAAKLKTPQMLQKQIALFKKDVRKINTYTVPEEQGW